MTTDIFTKQRKLVLYRGDRNREGRDFVTYGLLMGLRARFSDGGSSRMLDKPGGIVEYVLAHVGWNPGSDEEIFSKHSPVLSFSSSLEIAKSYMVGGKKSSCERCHVRDSDVLLYRLEFDPEDLSPTSLDHISWLLFERSVENCIPHLQASWTIEESLLLSRSQEIVRAENGLLHRALLIDVLGFLKARESEFCSKFPKKAAELYGPALEKADRDKEWLLYPFDPMEDCSSVPATIFVPNRHLHCEGYRIVPSC